jgi:hypothetical protein
MTRPRFLNPRRVLEWLDTAAAAFVALVVVGGLVFAVPM